MSVVGTKHPNQDSFPQIAPPEQASRYVRETDDPLLEITAYIPLLGILVSTQQQYFLNLGTAAISRDPTKKEVIEWISAVNRYTAMNATRNMISGALAIAGIALSIFTASYLSLALSFVGLGAAMIAIDGNLSGLQHNKTTLIDLRKQDHAPYVRAYLDNALHQFYVRNNQQGV